MANELGLAGVDCDICPLFALEATATALPDDCFDKVIFVSEHAVSYALQHAEALVNALADGAQWYAIGPATAVALEAGFGSSIDVCVPELARSEGLLQMPGLKAQALEAGQKVLLIAGEGGRQLIADTLTERRARVTIWRVYRRVSGSTDLVLERLKNLRHKVDVCVASSGAGLELLTSAWFAAAGSAEVPVCVPSPRIAELARALGWHRPVLCNGASAKATIKGLVDAGLLDANLLNEDFDSKKDNRQKDGS